MSEKKIKFEIELPFGITQADRRWIKRVSTVMALAVLELWRAGGRGRERELAAFFAAAPDLTLEDVRLAAGAAERIRAERTRGDAPPASKVAPRRLSQLITSGDLLGESDFCRRLGWSASTLAKAVAAERIFFLEYRGNRYYPSFYTDGAYDRRYLYSVTKALAGLAARSKLQFLLNPRGSLSKKTPLQALLERKRAAVVRAAEGFAQTTLRRTH